MNSINENSDASDARDKQKIALEMYRNVIGYLQYENAAYWTRAGFMLVVQSILVSLVGKLVVEGGDNKLHSSTVLAGTGLLGIALCAVSWRIASIGVKWTTRWKEKLVEI